MSSFSYRMFATKENQDHHFGEGLKQVGDSRHGSLSNRWVDDLLMVLAVWPHKPADSQPPAQSRDSKARLHQRRLAMMSAAIRRRDPLGVGLTLSHGDRKLMDLLALLLQFDPHERISLAEALQHPFFLKEDFTE
jgi:serine/threonine protein kinase